MSNTVRGDLSMPAKRALVMLLEDGFALRDTNYWRSPTDRRIYIRTIETLYDRYLVKIVVESRHKRRHTVKLTEVGEYAARDIQREFLLAPPDEPKSPHGISEKTARFIVEAIA